MTRILLVILFALLALFTRPAVACGPPECVIGEPIEMSRSYVYLPLVHNGTEEQPN